ncbi:MAG: zinc-ribbon domain-containing protein [Eubacteriales bacterium]|nr:zinc-ribbon domain-containing protein [Eubacteriales bacterium]
MFCSKCGARLADGAKKCDKCGAPVRVRSAAVSKKEKDADAAFDYAPRDLRKSQRQEETGNLPPVEEGPGGPVREKVSYGAVTPLEKVTRRIAIARHNLEERLEEDRMRRHIERAARHYEALGAEPTPILKAYKPPKKAESGKSGSAANVPKKAAVAAAAGTAAEVAAIEGQIAREREKKVRANQEARELTARRAAEAKASAEREAARIEQEAAGRAAEEKALAEQEAARRAAEAKASAERETARIEQEAAGRAAEEKALAEQEAARRAAEEKAKARQEREEAERLAAQALIARKEREARRKSREFSQRVLSEEEKQVQEARRIRRYYEEEPDGMDLFLGKFGLTKEAGVKLATLFLVVILSVIYVMGRGKAPAESGSPQAGEGMTGTQFSVSPESESTDGDSPFDNSDLPTGGGDFEHSQSDTDARQEGPDTQEPTGGEEP